ncbi:unnamed protein product, partial [Prunus brigantina]
LLKTLQVAVATLKVIHPSMPKVMKKAIWSQWLLLLRSACLALKFPFHANFWEE